MKVFGLVALLISFSAFAQGAEEDSPVNPDRRLTEQWLQMQREGEQASANPQSASVIEQEKAHERWLESYKHPIPDQFQVQDSNGS